MFPCQGDNGPAPKLSLWPCEPACCCRARGPGIPRSGDTQRTLKSPVQVVQCLQAVQHPRVPTKPASLLTGLTHSERPWTAGDYPETWATAAPLPAHIEADAPMELSRPSPPLQYTSWPPPPLIQAQPLASGTGPDLWLIHSFIHSFSSYQPRCSVKRGEQAQPA